MKNLERLRRCNHHLGAAMALLNEAFIMSGITTQRELVKVKLKMEHIIRRVEAGRERETKRALFK